MAKSISDNQKRRGRPSTTGITPMVGVRVPPEMRKRIERWAKQEGDEPALAVAIRRLVELGLAGSQPRKRTSPKAAAKASDMVAKRIDKLADPSMPKEERRARKRRLIKGPREFREMRGDLPKTKG